jgi:hypothetical protein
MKLTARLSGVLLSILLALGMGLRLGHLDQRSLWTDELFTLAVAQYHPLVANAGQPNYRRIQVMDISDADTFLTAKAAEQSPPLNDLLEKITVTWLGTTEIAARLPAALLGCALLLWFASFAWHQREPHLRRVLHWSVFLLALYPVLLMYAQEGRPYSAGAAFIGMGGLLWMLRWRDGWRPWCPPSWTEILFFCLASLTHYNATLLVALLLLPDAVMTIRQRSPQGGIRLVALGVVVSTWITLNSHAIFFTAKGGVAWGTAGTWYQIIENSTLDALAALHPYWLGFAATLLAVMVGLNCLGQPQEKYIARPVAQRLCALAVLTVTYLALAGKVAATAGMDHPRYFIFIVPFVAVAMAMVLAEIRSVPVALVVAFAFVIVAPASLRLDKSSNIDDFRAMSLAAVQGSDQSTVFLYPLPTLRDVYRVSLHRYLNADPIQRMVEVGTEQDVKHVCEQLKSKTHVVALGHAWGHAMVNAVYATCGQQWPNRSSDKFHNTFAEHWQAQ